MDSGHVYLTEYVYMYVLHGVCWSGLTRSVHVLVWHSQTFTNMHGYVPNIL